MSIRGFESERAVYAGLISLRKWHPARFPHRADQRRGVLLVTVPFHEDVYNNEIRARLTAAGAVEHLMTPPEYHDDPVNPAEGVLCYQVFGWKILDDLREVPGKSASVPLYLDLRASL